MLTFLYFAFAEQVTKSIGLAGSCVLSINYDKSSDTVVPTVTNSTKLNSLISDSFVYSTATYTTTGDCSKLHVYDHAKGEAPVELQANTLAVKNTTQCDDKTKQRHYMFDLWNSSMIEQELNLYYVCKSQSNGSGTLSLVALFVVFWIVLQ
eukprot:NODE_1251_length_1601_cov_0.796937.p2 type:complete len:151 gc:universal NODE_1251_length_1601_cov_0.796937:38-490(+)